MMYISLHITSNDDSYPTNIVRLIPVIGLLILVLSFLAGRISLLHSSLKNLRTEQLFLPTFFCLWVLFRCWLLLQRTFLGVNGMHLFSRRDFLKLSALIPISAALPPWAKKLHFSEKISEINSPTNIIIVLFDAMSARNLSVYGYPRNTTPNLVRFASRANVYHSHYSAGNFTTPGTTSLLTGLYPWTHRAI